MKATFKQFLEAKIKDYDTTPITDVDVLIKAIEENCSQAINNIRTKRKSGTIWRGFRREIVSGIYDPGSGQRESENTANFYTLFFDENPKNRNWPKRSKSFICSTDEITAAHFARRRAATLVLPFDNTPIGLVNESDLWDLAISFTLEYNGIRRVFTDGVEDLNAIFSDFYAQVENWAENKFTSLNQTAQDIRNNPIQICKSLKSRFDLEEFGVKEYSEEEYSFKRSVANQFADQLTEMYNLSKIGCTLTKINNLDVKSSEVWFQGKCILVSGTDLGEIMRHFKL